MKLIQCANAYEAVLTLERQEMDCKTAYALVKLKRKLQADVEFFLKEEKDLIDSYADRDEEGEIIQENPTKIQILDPEKRKEYESKRTELCEIEVQEELEPWRAPMPKAIQPVHLEALEGFIEFEGE